MSPASNGKGNGRIVLRYVHDVAHYAQAAIAAIKGNPELFIIKLQRLVPAGTIDRKHNPQAQMRAHTAFLRISVRPSVGLHRGKAQHLNLALANAQLLGCRFNHLAGSPGIGGTFPFLIEHKVIGFMIRTALQVIRIIL